MAVPDAVDAWGQAHDLGGVFTEAPVGGGCIANARIVRFVDGTEAFLKTLDDAPADMFAAEAAGLSALSVGGGPRIPEVHLHGEDFILMEALRPGRRRADYWETFGRQLAALHDHHGPCFGFEVDNYCGATPQKNPRTESGHEFFAEHRLLYQARLARDRGLVDRAMVRLIESVANRLERLVPEQPPSVIHGDLWSGNAHVTPDGAPALIDPATHWGWAEAELGMTTMFGRFDERFYTAYAEARALEPGWRGRLLLYNLYHQLNHVNLFGNSYVGGIFNICRCYL